MSLWPIHTIGDVATVIAGQSPEGSHYNEGGEGLPFYQGKKEFGDRFIGAPQVWTREVTKEAKEGDLLISVRAPVGPVNFATEPCCIGRGLAAIRAKSSMLPEFLFYFFRHIEPSITGNAGAVFPSINKSQIEAIKIPLPPLAEQKRIVTILDEAFAGIDKASANTTRNLANARELFDNHVASYFAAPSAAWKKAPLEDVCKGFEYGTAQKSEAQGKMPVLRMGNIQDGEIDWDDLVYSNDKDDIRRYELKEGDVLFNRTNSAEHVGKSAIYRGEQKAIFAGYLIRVNYDRSIIDGEFLNFYLNSPAGRGYGKTVMAQSVHQANISGGKLRRYPFAYPSLSQQRGLSAELHKLKSTTESLRGVYTSKLASLNELKSCLLHQAFSGNLTGKEAEAA